MGKTAAEINRIIEKETEARGLNTQATLQGTDSLEGNIWATGEATDTMTLYTDAQVAASFASMLLADGLASADKVMLQSAATQDLLKEGYDRMPSALNKIKEKAIETADELVHSWERAIPDGQKMIEGAMKYAEYMSSEIPALITEIEKVDEAVLAKVITPEEAEPMYRSSVLDWPDLLNSADRKRTYLISLYV